VYLGLICGGEIFCEFVDACFEGVSCDCGCKCEIYNVLGSKGFHVLPAFADYVFL